MHVVSQSHPPWLNPQFFLEHFAFFFRIFLRYGQPCDVFDAISEAFLHVRTRLSPEEPGTAKEFAAAWRRQVLQRLHSIQRCARSPLGLDSRPLKDENGKVRRDLYGAPIYPAHAIRGVIFDDTRDPGATPVALLEQEETAQLTTQLARLIIDALPDAQRITLIMWANGYSCVQTSWALGVARATVSRHRASTRVLALKALAQLGLSEADVLAILRAG